MTMGLLGKKLGMTQIFDPNGLIVPVTLIEAGPCPILQKKSVQRDGYNALQLGFDPRPNGRANRPLAGRLKASGAKPPRFIREVRTEEPVNLEVGALLDVTLFKVGDKIDVTGTSKGRGFAGPMKKHHSSRGPESHGSMYHRRTGSLGQSAWPSRVYKGKPMAGHMGNVRCTVQNLEVAQIDPERNLLVVKGAVPSHVNGYLIIRKAVRVAKKSR